MHISPCVDLCLLWIAADSHLWKLMNLLQCESTPLYCCVYMHRMYSCWTKVWDICVSLRCFRVSWTRTSAIQRGSGVVWICAKLQCTDSREPTAQKSAGDRWPSGHLWNDAVEMSVNLNSKSYTCIIVNVPLLHFHTTETIVPSSNLQTMSTHACCTIRYWARLTWSKEIQMKHMKYWPGAITSR